MAGNLRWIVAAVLMLHGLVHFLGVAKGFGLADVPQLTQPITRLGGVGWLAAGAAMLLTAGLLSASSPTWLWVAPVAAVLSQAMIVSSWPDAKFGTIVNVLLVIAAAWSFATEGPTSLRAEYRHEVNRRASVHWTATVVGEDDVARLPEPDAIDASSARVTYTLGEHTVAAVVSIDEAGDLVDFVSDDRAALGSGEQLTRMRWSTPISSHQTIRGTRTMLHGEGRWLAPAGAYAYIELDLLDLLHEPVAVANTT